MSCLQCGLRIKNLTRYRSKNERYCRCNSDYPNKYHFDFLIIGEIKYYPWTNEVKCYNYKDSNNLRNSLRQYIKKYGGQFYVRRHLAGMEVTRLS